MYYVLSVEFFHISTSIYIFLFDEKSYIIAQFFTENFQHITKYIFHLESRNEWKSHFSSYKLQRS